MSPTRSKPTEPRLDIAPGLSLPLQAVTETFAILAKKRVGKSNAAVVMAEEMYRHGLPWVAIDPKGDWWGIRSSGQGDAPGLAVTVFGGRHGDVPLEPTAGNLLADLVVDQRLTCVLDVSEMDDTDQQRFLLDFAKRLYDRNTEPLHVFCEEADDYIPQAARGDELDVVRAFTRLVKRGGFRGIGVTMITQRSALLHKNVLTQTEGLIVLRTTAPNDRKVVAEWVASAVDRSEIAADLPSLANGEAWVIAPHLLGDPARVQFRRRHTFDSGATPTVGSATRRPTTLAAIDLDAIKNAMADTIERAQAEDPDSLRRRIAILERDLAAARKHQPAPEPQTVTQVVEVPALSPEQETLLDTASERVREYAANASTRAEQAVTQIRAEVERMAGLVDAVRQAAVTAPPATPPQPARRAATASPRTTTPTATQPAPARMASGPGVPLAKAERLILTALAQHGPRTVQQVAVLTAYSAKGGGFRNTLSALRTAGRITGTGTIEITDEGLAALGEYDPLPTGPALLDWWKAHPRIGKAEAAILDVLVQAWPNEVPIDQIAEATDYSAAGGGFRNALSRLRTLDLAAGRGAMTASEDLAR